MRKTMQAVRQLAQDFYMYKQGESDGACGFYCILAMVDNLLYPTWTLAQRRTYNRGPWQWLRRQTGEPSRIEQFLWRGLPGNAVAQIVSGLGLSASGKTHTALAALISLVQSVHKEDGYVLATVRFTYLPRYADDDRDNSKHLIVVLDYIEADDCFIVADPHPWVAKQMIWPQHHPGDATPAVYAIKSADFWRGYATQHRGHALVVLPPAVAPSAAGRRRRSAGGARARR